MLIDTHCHLDAPEFDADRQTVMAAALAAGVGCIVIPAVMRDNFDVVRQLAHDLPQAAHSGSGSSSVVGADAGAGVGAIQGAYALGIHPLYVPQARDEDLADLDAHLTAARDDPRLVAIGEIGLDFFVPELTTPSMRDRQTAFYVAQLDLAQRHGLPVILHVRRSQDALLKPLRRRPAIGGIAHAFNGSAQQAQQFIDLGFALGFGGAMTYARALQIRRLATQLPLDALVLETDAPDIPPAWLSAPGQRPGRNAPAELARIAQELAALRGLDVGALASACAGNARRVLPRLADLLRMTQA